MTNTIKPSTDNTTPQNTDNAPQNTLVQENKIGSAIKAILNKPNITNKEWERKNFLTHFESKEDVILDNLENSNYDIKYLKKYFSLVKQNKDNIEIFYDENDLILFFENFMGIVDDFLSYNVLEDEEENKQHIILNLDDFNVFKKIILENEINTETTVPNNDYLEKKLFLKDNIISEENIKKKKKKYLLYILDNYHFFEKNFLGKIKNKEVALSLNYLKIQYLDLLYFYNINDDNTEQLIKQSIHEFLNIYENKIENKEETHLLMQRGFIGYFESKYNDKDKKDFFNYLLKAIEGEQKSNIQHDNIMNIALFIYNDVNNLKYETFEGLMDLLLHQIKNNTELLKINKNDENYCEELEYRNFEYFKTILDFAKNSLCIIKEEEDKNKSCLIEFIGELIKSNHISTNTYSFFVEILNILYNEKKYIFDYYSNEIKNYIELLPDIEKSLDDIKKDIISKTDSFFAYNQKLDEDVLTEEEKNEFFHDGIVLENILHFFYYEVCKNLEKRN